MSHIANQELQEFVITKLEMKGIDLAEVNFDRLDWDMVARGKLQYEPDPNCSTCDGSGKFRFGIGYNDKEVLCPTCTKLP